MNAYFKGLGMNGIVDIDAMKPSYFLTLPKKLNSMSADIRMCNDSVVNINNHWLVVEFRQVGVIPVYELVDIK